MNYCNLPETNIVSENRSGPQKKKNLPTMNFQVQTVNSLLVSGRVMIGHSNRKKTLTLMDAPAGLPLRSRRNHPLMDLQTIHFFFKVGNWVDFPKKRF